MNHPEDLLLIYVMLPSQNNNYQTKWNQNTEVSRRIKLVSILNKRQWKEATIIGGALILGGQGLLTWGEQYLSFSVTALLFSTVAIWVLMLGKILYGDGLKRFTVLGVIMMAINNILKSSFYHNFDTKVYNVYVQFLNDFNVVFWCVDVNYF